MTATLRCPVCVMPVAANAKRDTQRIDTCCVNTQCAGWGAPLLFTKINDVFVLTDER